MTQVQNVVTYLINRVINTVAWAVRTVRISADVTTLATPHDVIAAGSTQAVESAQNLDHVTGRRTSEHHFRYPASTIEALTCRQHRRRCCINRNYPTVIRHRSNTATAILCGIHSAYILWSIKLKCTTLNLFYDTMFFSIFAVTKAPSCVSSLDPASHNGPVTSCVLQLRACFD